MTPPVAPTCHLTPYLTSFAQNITHSIQVNAQCDTCPLRSFHKTISVLHKQLYAAATSLPSVMSPYTPSEPPSTTTCRSISCLRTRSYLLSRSFRSMDTGSITITTFLDPISSRQTWLQCRGMLSLRCTFRRAAVILENPGFPTPRTLTST